MIVSTLVLAVVGMLISDKIVEPRLGEYKGSAKMGIACTYICSNASTIKL